MRGWFVSGTDTGVGKTVLSAAIVAALRARGHAVTACKPVATGLDEPPESAWPRDHELLAQVAGSRPEDVVLATFGPPVSPHFAAELCGRQLSLLELVAGIRAAADADADGALVVEGVGGLLVPLAPGADVRDLAGELGLPLLIAARPGLGTINHTLLTLEAARAAGLSVTAVVLTPWPGQPEPIERSNRETIERLGEVEVATLATVTEPTTEQLAARGAALPLARWLDSQH